MTEKVSHQKETSIAERPAEHYQSSQLLAVQALKHHEHSPDSDEALSKEKPEKTTLAERHPDWPELDISFYFSPHGNRADTEGITSRLADADIYLIEGSSPFATADVSLAAHNVHNRSLEETVNSFGNGNLRGYESAMGPIIEGIYNTGKSVESFDLKRMDPEERAIEEAIQEVLRKPIVIADTFEESLQSLQETAAKNAELQLQREAIMAERFEEKIESILSYRDDLKAKPRLKILISMGSFHTTLRHTMAEKGIPSSREFFSSPTYDDSDAVGPLDDNELEYEFNASHDSSTSTSSSREQSRTPYVYDHGTELVRTFAYNRQPSQELLEKAWVERVLVHSMSQMWEQRHGYSRLTDSGIALNTVSLYMRSMVSRFTPEQRRQIYTIARDHRDNMDVIPEKLQAFLKDAGFGGLPEDPDELIAAKN